MKKRVSAKRSVAEAEYDETVSKYFKVIKNYDAKFKEWRGRCEKVVKRYRDEGKSISTQLTSTARMNILWANTNILAPAMFSAIPKPDVMRRWRDNDPVGRVAALLLERGLEYELDQYDDFSSTMTQCVMDKILTSRGTAWVRYEPTFEPFEDAVQVTDDVAQDEIDEEEQNPDAPNEGSETPGEEAGPGESVVHECAPVDFVHWKDFGHNVARTWKEVDIVWRIVYMTKDAAEERFGEQGSKIPIESNPNSPDNRVGSTFAGQEEAKAKVYEVWDKARRKVIFIAKGVPNVLDEVDDPLGLDDFWPCPAPLFGTMTSDTLVPVPDFVLYQDLANELDIITDRIDGLIRALKVCGVYNATYPELQRLFTEASNTDMVPIKDWATFAAANGLEGALDLVPLDPIFKALEAAYAARKECIDQIYQVTGIGDLMRFDSDPQATATAERMKGQYGSLRLRAQQKDVVRFATDIIKLKAQIICNKFQPEMLMKIGGAAQLMPDDQQLVPQAIELLRSNVLREFRVEVSSDALVQMDETQEKQDRLEFLSAVGQFMEKMQQAVTSSPAMAPVVVELFKYGVTGFKVGKSVEGMLDHAADQLRQNPPQTPPDPETTKAQAAQQLEQQRGQTDMQIAQMKGQVDIAVAKAKAEADVQVAQAQQDAQERQAQQQAQLELAKHQAEVASQERLALHQAQLDAVDKDKQRAHEHALKDKEYIHASAAEKLRALTAIVTAEISAGAAVKPEQQQAADATIAGETPAPAPAPMPQEPSPARKALEQAIGVNPAG